MFFILKTPKQTYINLKSFLIFYFYIERFLQWKRLKLDVFYIENT
jgi:hypothetical protein